MSQMLFGRATDHRLFFCLLDFCFLDLVKRPFSAICFSTEVAVQKSGEPETRD